MKNNNYSLRCSAVAFFTAFLSLASFSSANVQVIHNCATPGADTVDIWLKGFKVIDNLVFRKATAFVSAPANEAIVFGIAPGNSTSQADTIASFAFPPLTDNQNYIIIASGVIGTGYAANPDGRNIKFDLKVISNAKTTSGIPGKVDFAIFHGATDAPGVDVKVSGGGPTLASNAKYGDATAYLAVDPASYNVDVLPAGGSTPVATYVADLSSLTGGAAVVFASGFLTPSSNNNGPAFGLYAALPNGNVNVLPLITGISDLAAEIGWNMFPNPNQGNAFIGFNLKQDEKVSIDILNMNGSVVKQVMNAKLGAGRQNLSADLSDLSNGMYLARISTTEKSAISKFTVVR